MLGEREAAEQQRGVEQIAGQRVLEERDRRDVAGVEPGECHADRSR